MHRLRSTRVIKWGEVSIFPSPAPLSLLFFLPPLFLPFSSFSRPSSPLLFFIQPLFLLFSSLSSPSFSPSLLSIALLSLSFWASFSIFFLRLSLDPLHLFLTHPLFSPSSHLLYPLVSFLPVLSPVTQSPLLNVKESIVGQDYEKAKLWNFPNSS